MHLQLAAEDGLNLLWREAVRPLRSRLEVAKALQEERPGTLRSKRIWGSLITPSGCAQLVRRRLAAMCKTASGLPEIANRPLPDTSTLRNLFRSFPQTAYLSGR